MEKNQETKSPKRSRVLSPPNTQKGHAQKKVKVIVKEDELPSADNYDSEVGVYHSSDYCYMYSPILGKPGTVIEHDGKKYYASCLLFADKFHDINSRLQDFELHPLTELTPIYPYAADGSIIGVFKRSMMKENEKLEGMGMDLTKAEAFGELTNKITLITRVIVKGYDKVRNKLAEEKDIRFLENLKNMNNKELLKISRELEEQLPVLK